MNENLMILNHPKDANKVFLLVDADYLDDYPFGRDYGFEMMARDYVKGMMQLAPVNSERNGACYGSLMVKRSSAEDGYGPTMYDIVMEITNQPLINDRDSVSREAESMMKYYLTNRGDVDKKLLDNVDDLATYPRTPEVEDDCTPGDMRNYNNGRNERQGLWEDDPLAYSYNKDLTARAQEMLALGNKCIQMHQMEYWDIRKLASEFFKTRF